MTGVQTCALPIYPKLCLALCRWEITDYGSARFIYREDSQDVWIFNGAVPKIEGADFFAGGVAGCDNKIAHLLFENGYRLESPSFDIRTYHLHLSGVRNYVSNGVVTERLDPPYKTLELVYFANLIGE